MFVSGVVVWPTRHSCLGSQSKGDNLNPEVNTWERQREKQNSKQCLASWGKSILSWCEILGPISSSRNVITELEQKQHGDYHVKEGSFLGKIGTPSLAWRHLWIKFVWNKAPKYKQEGAGQQKTAGQMLLERFPLLTSLLGAWGCLLLS